jgi:hypothetical protein
MGLYIGTSFVTNSDGLTHKSFASVGINTNSEFVGIITASDGVADDQFGYSVAVGSGRIVVGTPYKTIGSNADQGAAYIYDLDGNEVGIITDVSGAAGDRFGWSVAAGSGRIVVGAPFNNIGFNGDQGSAYIYDLDGNQLGIITASDGATSDLFGNSVAVGSGRIVVGAYSNDIGSNANQGSAYIFDLDGNEVGIITASDGAANDEFGYSVAVGSGRIVVGTPYKTIGSNDDQGSAYIFDLNGNQLGIITASDAAALDRFGWSVAVGSGKIVVGAPYNNIPQIDQGSAYIFDLNGNQLGIITASDGAILDQFGYSVAVGSGKIVVGADGYNIDRGSAYIFDLDGNEVGIITASDGAADDRFGYSVAVGSGRIVVGADGDDNNGSSSGSAYIWKTNETLSDYYDEIVDHYRY